MLSAQCGCFHSTPDTHPDSRPPDKRRQRHIRGPRPARRPPHPESPQACGCSPKRASAGSTKAPRPEPDNVAPLVEILSGGEKIRFSVIAGPWRRNERSGVVVFAKVTLFVIDN